VGATCPETLSVGGYTAVDFSTGAADPECIVVKLAGATQGGGGVGVDVTVRDVTSGP
jgi:hypothetical protein